jgi:hypothetical protein
MLQGAKRKRQKSHIVPEGSMKKPVKTICTLPRWNVILLRLCVFGLAANQGICQRTVVFIKWILTEKV